jgi:hypothetical protein
VNTALTLLTSLRHEQSCGLLWLRWPLIHPEPNLRHLPGWARRLPPMGSPWHSNSGGSHDDREHRQADNAEAQESPDLRQCLEAPVRAL